LATVDLMLDFIQKIYKNSFDSFIAPPFCAHCKIYLENRDIFCALCSEKIAPIISTQIRLNSLYTMNVFAISDYKEPLRSLIMGKSFGNIIASYQLGQLLLKHTNIHQIPADYIIPVPLHWMRFAKRGYNQGEEIAKIIAENKKIPVAHLVKRVAWSPFQSKVEFEKRASNVKNIFKLIENSEHYHNKNLIIIDDLMTSGATLREFAKVLLPLKPASINCFVPCRVIR
jgi:ComF family protein